MLARLLPIRPLQALFRAVCWQPSGLARCHGDADGLAARREPSRERPFQSLATHGSGRRQMARGSFRYLRLDACDH